MPELPIPWTNGQSPPTHGPSSISSFDPAARTLGLVGSIATVGSFCLFCGKGVGGLPVLTSASTAACAATGTAPIDSTTRETTNQPRFSIRSSCGQSPRADPTPDTTSRSRGELAQALLEHRQLSLDLGGKLVAESRQVLLQLRHLCPERIVVDAEQVLHGLIGDVQPVGVELAGRRQQADRRTHGLALVVAAAEDPHEHTAVLAETRPQELA